MTDDLTRLLDPNAATRLGRSDRETVPIDTGLYGVWLLDQRAVRDCGIAGSAPLLIYIGKAAGREGLRQRIVRRHVPFSWPQLADLLASRGRVLPPWWQSLPRSNAGGWMKPTSPLASLAEQQVVDWQHRHLRWSWQALPAERVTAAETALIREHRPLLNRTRKSEGLPQLRQAGLYGRARMRWLWQSAWAGLLLRGRTTPRLDAPWKRWHKSPAVDVNGYPSDRRGAIMIPTPHTPNRRDLLALMHDAAASAPNSVKRAVEQTQDAVELRVWWAANAGAPWLTQPASVRESLAATLEMRAEKEAPCPAEFPDDETLPSVVRLVSRTLNFGYH